jgi:hypothetical protein
MVPVELQIELLLCRLQEAAAGVTYTEWESLFVFYLSLMPMLNNEKNIFKLTYEFLKAFPSYLRISNSRALSYLQLYELFWRSSEVKRESFSSLETWTRAIGKLTRVSEPVLITFALSGILTSSANNIISYRCRNFIERGLQNVLRLSSDDLFKNNKESYTLLYILAKLHAKHSMVPTVFFQALEPFQAFSKLLSLSEQISLIDPSCKDALLNPIYENLGPISKLQADLLQTLSSVQLAVKILEILNNFQAPASYIQLYTQFITFEGFIRWLLVYPKISSAERASISSRTLFIIQRIYHRALQDGATQNENFRFCFYACLDIIAIEPHIAADTIVKFNNTCNFDCISNIIFLLDITEELIAILPYKLIDQFILPKILRSLKPTKDPLSKSLLESAHTTFLAITRIILIQRYFRRIFASILKVFST